MNSKLSYLYSLLNKMIFFHMKFKILFTLFLLLLTLNNCGSTKKKEKVVYPPFALKYVPQSESDYEGNLVVQVFDEKGQELEGAAIEIHARGNMQAGESLETSIIVFQQVLMPLKVVALKKGYKTVETNVFAIKKGEVCFVEFHLRKD